MLQNRLVTNSINRLHHWPLIISIISISIIIIIIIIIIFITSISIIITSISIVHYSFIYYIIDCSVYTLVQYALQGGGREKMFQ